MTLLESLRLKRIQFHVTNLIASNSVQTLGERRTLGLPLRRPGPTFVGHFVQDGDQASFPNQVNVRRGRGRTGTLRSLGSPRAPLGTDRFTPEYVPTGPTWWLMTGSHVASAHFTRGCLPLVSQAGSVPFNQPQVHPGAQATVQATKWVTAGTLATPVVDSSGED